MLSTTVLDGLPVARPSQADPFGSGNQFSQGPNVIFSITLRR